jgi:hypothetical protein
MTLLCSLGSGLEKKEKESISKKIESQIFGEFFFFNYYFYMANKRIWGNILKVQIGFSNFN